MPNHAAMLPADDLADSASSLAMPTFERTTRILAPARRVYLWHMEPGTLDRLIPPWESVAVQEAPAELCDGARVVLLIRVGPLRLRWVAEHRGVIDRGPDGGEFIDDQISGPFRLWSHRHVVRAVGPNACVLEDRVEYELPIGRVGQWLGGWLVRRKLARMFAFRHAVTKKMTEETGATNAGAGTAGSRGVGGGGVSP